MKHDSPQHHLYFILSILILFGLFITVGSDRRAQHTTRTQTQPTPTIAPKPTLTPFVREIPANICDPSNRYFSANITNTYFPLPVGKTYSLRTKDDEMQFLVMPGIVTVDTASTRVLEVRVLKNTKLVEVSRNYYAQTIDGTVCNFGKDVAQYENDQIIKHDGAWMAGSDHNKPGIQMPANPQPGQVYARENAPGIAHTLITNGEMLATYKTTTVTYKNVLTTTDASGSASFYAPNVGLVSQGDFTREN